MVLELQQAWHCDHCPGKPTPGPRHSLSEELPCDIQPEPPPVLLHAVVQNLCIRNIRNGLGESKQAALDSHEY